MTKKIGNDVSVEVANADDMMKQWPKMDLLMFCGFPGLARKNLCRWFWGDKDTRANGNFFRIGIFTLYF